MINDTRKELMESIRKLVMSHEALHDDIVGMNIVFIPRQEDAIQYCYDGEKFVSGLDESTELMKRLND